MTDLRPVKRAAAKAARAREDLDAKIRAAREAGAPLREIAEAAGLSHEEIRRRVQKDDR